MNSFQIHEELNGEVLVFELPERVDLNVSDELKDTLLELVEQGHFKLVFNLEKTRYMDSSGLGAVVSRIAATRANKGDIRLASPTEFIEELLEITHLNQILKCFDNLQDAVDSFK